MKETGVTLFATASLAAILLLGGTAVAQSNQIQGVINGRNGATMTVQTQDTGNVVVLLTPDTVAEDVAGVFHARKKQMSVTVLVPGLQVQVQGTYNAQNQLVAFADLAHVNADEYRQVQWQEPAVGYRHSGWRRSGGAADAATAAGIGPTTGEAAAATGATDGGAATAGG